MGQLTHPDTFFWRRLHSLSGIVPVGGFLVFHFLVNSFALGGPEPFDSAVDVLRGLPYLRLLEILILYVPIAYHGFYGLYIALTGQNNLPQYPYARNALYVMQRATGVITFLFIGYHVATTTFAAETPYFEYMSAALKHPGIAAIYVVGVLSTSFHFATGLWNFLIKWGITVGPLAQRAALAVCMVIFIVLAGTGLNLVRTFAL